MSHNRHNRHIIVESVNWRNEGNLFDKHLIIFLIFNRRIIDIDLCPDRQIMSLASCPLSPDSIFKLHKNIMFSAGCCVVDITTN